MSAEDIACQACDALPGEPCRWDCIGLAAEVDRLDEAVSDTKSVPSVPDTHCLVCQAATPAACDYLIARALTVAASKAYAALHYRAELDAR